MTEDSPIDNVNDTNFQDTISSGLVLVDFSAEWCGPCRMLTPVLKDLAQKLEDKLVIRKLDIDANQTTTNSYQVTSVPTLILFKDGQEVNRVIGVRDADALEEIVLQAQA